MKSIPYLANRATPPPANAVGQIATTWLINDSILYIMPSMKVRPEDIARKHGGWIRTNEAQKFGIPRSTIYALANKGIFERMERGVYRLAELPPPGHPDLAIVALRVPHAVVCLISALAWHDLTTQIPRAVSIAIPRGARAPTLRHPPVEIHRFSDKAYKAGTEIHLVDGIPVKIYSPEKTLVDCFRFRNKIGMDVFLEAMKLYKERKRIKPAELSRHARDLRVEKAILPYLEAIL